jgi:hypothetical protein
VTLTLDLPDDLIEYVEWLANYEDIRTELAWIKVVKAGKSRCEQLRRYAEKRKDPSATFRPYAPLKLSEHERGSVKRAAEAEGVATTRDPFPWRCQVRDELDRRCKLPASHVGEVAIRASLHDFGY